MVEDLEGPIAQASDKEHRHILTLMDYATRYPEAVRLKNIDTETVADSDVVKTITYKTKTL